MKVLLTGVSGSLGHEVALELHKRGIEIIPVVRPKKIIPLVNQIKFPLVIETDLTRSEAFEAPSNVDCVVHCAGNIHFRDTGNTNEAMMKTLTKSVVNSRIPIHYVSTAFVYRPDEVKIVFNNNYEQDKYNSEQVLISSGIPHSIIRPSVLVGNSKTGEIQNFSGYYSIVKGFLEAVASTKKKGKKLRFPNLPGKSDLVTVDQAAYYIGDIVENKRLDLVYITNPNSPRASWILEETIKFFKVSNSVSLLNTTFKNYGKLDLSDEERRLYNFSMHFNPYWTINYEFPGTICSENLIDHEYLTRTLSYFSNLNFNKNE